MISLTIDMNFSELNTAHDGYESDGSTEILLRFLDMLEAANVSSTVFFSCDSFNNDFEIIKKISENPVVEIGGHNLNEKTPLNWSRYWATTLGHAMGPIDFQHWQVEKTVEAIYKNTGRKIRSWRNSSEINQSYNPSVLAELGIQVCSGGIDYESLGPKWNHAGIINFPINIDATQIKTNQSMVMHNDNSMEDNSMERLDDLFYEGRSSGYAMEIWAIDLLEHLTRNEMNGIISQINIDPIELYKCDRFQTFEEYVLEYLELRDTVQISRIYDWEIQRIHYANRQN